MANLYRDIHQTVKSFSIENKLNLHLNNRIPLKCHFNSKKGFIKSVKLYGGGEVNKYVIVIKAKDEILSGRNFEEFKSLVEELLTRLKVCFPDIEMAKRFTNKPIQYGTVKFKLSNVKEETVNDE